MADPAAPSAPATVTYTPMRRPALPVVPASVLAPAPPATVPAVRSPAAPAGLVAAPVPVAAVAIPSPAPLPAAGPFGALGAGSTAGDMSTPVIAAHASRPVGPSRHVLGVASDVGMPDGLNVGLVAAPVDWLRLGLSAGSNSASLDYRAGLSFVPMGWGPSFSFEVGHCNTAATTSVIRYFFSVPAWVQPYVQQLGYTYFNAHVGYDWSIGNVTLFAHGGYTYLRGTVRAPQPVVIDKSNTSVTITQDGSVYAHTMSAKVGLIYMFGGI
jgi:hypothetical protein